MEKRYINIDELAVYTGVKKRTLYSWTMQDRIPCFRVCGKKLRFDVQQIDAWMEVWANKVRENKH